MSNGLPPDTIEPNDLRAVDLIYWWLPAASMRRSASRIGRLKAVAAYTKINNSAFRYTFVDGARNFRFGLCGIPGPHRESAPQMEYLRSTPASATFCILARPR